MSKKLRFEPLESRVLLTGNGIYHDHDADTLSVHGRLRDGQQHEVSLEVAASVARLWGDAPSVHKQVEEQLAAEVSITGVATGAVTVSAISTVATVAITDPSLSFGAVLRTTSTIIEVSGRGTVELEIFASAEARKRHICQPNRLCPIELSPPDIDRSEEAGMYAELELQGRSYHAQIELRTEYVLVGAGVDESYVGSAEVARVTSRIAVNAGAFRVHTSGVVSINQLHWAARPGSIADTSGAWDALGYLDAEGSGHLQVAREAYYSAFAGSIFGLPASTTQRQYGTRVQFAMDSDVTGRLSAEMYIYDEEREPEPVGQEGYRGHDLADQPEGEYLLTGSNLLTGRHLLPALDSYFGLLGQ